MKVRLISLTRPVQEILDTHKIQDSPEALIAWKARVSSPNQDNKSFEKLLSYCARNKHWSIFEMADMTVEVITSRSIAPQILRHRSYSFQEKSQRYSEPQGYQKLKLRRQDTKNRQNSIDDFPVAWQDEFEKDQQEVWDFCYGKYQKWISRGAAKEQARDLLPLATTTKLYMKGSIRSWMTYCGVRCEMSTQLEHREIALECYKILIQHFPTLQASMEAQWPFLKGKI